MSTRLTSTRYVGTSSGSTSRPRKSATYQLRCTPSRNRPRSCAYDVLKTKRMPGSDLLATHGPEHPLWSDGQDGQQHDVGGDVLEPVREVGARAELDQSDGEAADQRARDRAEATEHGGGEGLEADEAQIDVDQRDRRQQHA